VQTLPTQDIDVNAIYLVPITDPQTSDNYAEYIYLNGVWEKLGETPIEIDLTDYVKNTDYATANKGGVVKISTTLRRFGIDSNGIPQAMSATYNDYISSGVSNNAFIGKGTLENVITGKGLVSNTDYATSSTGGVIKTGANGFSITSDGKLTGVNSTYAQYGEKGNTYAISKGTLENVITGKGLVSDTDYATDSKAGVIKKGNQFNVSEAGTPYCNGVTYNNYSGIAGGSFISKATLENVITGKGLVSNTDYATANTAGVIKRRDALGFGVDNAGMPYSVVKTYEQYSSYNNAGFISKGTLENVLSARFVTLTQSEYDQLTPDANTFYFITD
jgi:hypothetical protein